MKRRVVFTYSLTQKQATEWDHFFHRYENGTYFQLPKWLQLTQPYRKPNFFMLYEVDKLLAVGTIIENKIVANVVFGPLCETPEIYVEAVKEIRNHYKKKKKFAELRVTQPIIVSSLSESIEYSIYRKIPFKQLLNKENLFSIATDLSKSQEDIFRSYNTRNRRGVKKAIKSGFLVQELNSFSRIKEFAKIYDSMVATRNIKNQFISTQTSFQSIFSFFQERGLGRLLGVFNKEGKMMGGMILLFKDDYVYYDIGASDPKFRKMPIMHLLIHQAMIMSKEMGYKWFDLGGYNLMGSEKDQVANINKFKEGFGGIPLIYPKRMYFKLNVLPYLLFKLGLFIRRKIMK